MHSIALLSAFVAVGSTVVFAATCTSDITVSSATPVISCDVVSGSITVDEDVSGDLVITGPTEVTGDFIISNATKLISVSSSSITSIGGKFQLESLELLSSLSMPALRNLSEVDFIKLPQLSSVNFGSSGVTKVSSIRVTDTFISDLSGLNVASIENFQIDNNKKMTNFDSDLVNITGQLIINNNGNNMSISMLKLELASEIQISNVKSFEVPLLSQISESIKFDTNPEFESFAAPNLTKITDDVSFINNDQLTNISMPLLESISGGFTIQNNSAIRTIDGFPKLATVSGGIILLGNFSKVELPALNDVKGSVNVQSTTDISNFCDFFDNLKKNGSIQGSEKCKSNNTQANAGSDGGNSNSNSSSSSSSKDAAGSVVVNMVLLGLTGFVALVHLL